MRFVLSAFSGLVICGLTAVADQKMVGVDPLEEASRQFLDARTDDALVSISCAQESGAPEVSILSLRGAVFLEQGKLDQALADFQAAVEKDPTLAPPRLHLGGVFLRQKKWEEARAAYEEAFKKTNILILSERLRYAILLTYLGAKDDVGAKTALARIPFPTESPAYYYAQAAFAFAHGNRRTAEKWLNTAAKIFDKKDTAWFARPLYDLGWIKDKPPPVLD